MQHGVALERISLDKNSLCVALRHISFLVGRLEWPCPERLSPIHKCVAHALRVRRGCVARGGLVLRARARRGALPPLCAHAGSCAPHALRSPTLTSRLCLRVRGTACRLRVSPIPFLENGLVLRNQDKGSRQGWATTPPTPRPKPRRHSTARSCASSALEQSSMSGLHSAHPKTIGHQRTYRQNQAHIS